VEKFLQAAVSLISNKNHPACNLVAKHLKLLDTTSCFHNPTMADQTPLACSYLKQALASQFAINFCENVASVSEQLNWTEAPRGKISSYMDDNHAMVQIVGPDHGFLSEKVRFGIFLLAPNTIYPLHSHAAEEIYIPISGSGHWRIQEAPYLLKKNGSVVHCQPWIPHAIRSGKKPLLMLWAWVGDISFQAYRIEPNAFDDNGDPI